MSTKTDELMKLADEHANLHACDAAGHDIGDSVRLKWESLRVAIQEVVKDAERYRWLRDVESDFAICRWNGGDYYHNCGDAIDVDSSIDAAMKPEAP